MIKRNPRIIKRNIEAWKLIEGFKDYEISNMGRVKSLNRYVECTNGIRFYTGKVLMPGKDNHGYLIIDIYLKKKSKTKAIHSMVIRHFGKPQPTPKHECNHIDGDKLNNWDTNLEWMTRKENIQHAINIGLKKSMKGRNNHSAKLVEKEIKEIKRIYKTGKYTYKQLSEEFGVSASSIGKIIRRERWKYI